MRTPSARISHRFKTTRFDFVLWRLQDHEYASLRERSFSIDLGRIDFDLTCADCHKPIDQQLMLPKVVVWMERKFGKSSGSLDSSKQGFAFPFLMNLDKDGKSYSYLIRIEDVSGGLFFRLRRIVVEDKYLGVSSSHQQKTIDGEMNEEDFAYLISFLWGYLQGASNVFCEEKKSEILPFYYEIDRSDLIYGFVEGEFFEWSFEESEKYQIACENLRDKCGIAYVSPIEKIPETRAILQSIIDYSGVIL